MAIFRTILIMSPVVFLISAAILRARDQRRAAQLGISWPEYQWRKYEEQRKKYEERRK